VDKLNKKIFFLLSLKLKRVIFSPIILLQSDMEVEINNTRIKYEDGKVSSYIKKGNSKVFKWFHLEGGINNGYIVIGINKKNYLYSRVMYKIYNPEWDIEDTSMNNYIDHKDGNTLNNNIDNLQKKTHQQNCWNQVRAKGYCWNKSKNKYQAQICVNNEIKHLGHFDNETDARNAYLEAKKIHHKIS